MAGACGSGEKELVEPSLEGNHDISECIDEKGKIEFGQAVQGEFTEDLEFHGYRFMASAGADISLQVTQKGTSRGLDTTLWIYGPRAQTGGFGDACIHRDDDSGRGACPRLKGVGLGANGEYMAVVGTADGTGRGVYRLELFCLKNNCTEVEIDHCPEDLKQDFRDCVDEVETESEHQTTGLEALDLCLTDHAGGIYRYNCELGWHAPPEWCLVNAADFADRLVPLCRVELEPI
jgi:hypothetical protein